MGLRRKRVCDAVTGADSGFGSFSFVGTPNYYIPGTCPNDPMTGKPSCFFGPPPTFGEHVDFDPVPEPSTLAMLSAGLVGFWLFREARIHRDKRIQLKRRCPSVPAYYGGYHTQFV